MIFDLFSNIVRIEPVLQTSPSAGFVEELPESDR